jgi:hypothetical protein
MGADAIDGSNSGEFVIGGYLSPVSDAYGKKGLGASRPGPFGSRSPIFLQQAQYMI